MNLWPFITTLLIIAVAELGDKTQLLTLGLATKYPVWKVISAVSLATAILMALAVTFGRAINSYVPTLYIQLFAGIVFIIFGLWILLGKSIDSSTKLAARDKENKSPNILIAIFIIFFLAELGDKTQLATFLLSAKYGNPFQVWLGATLGMVGINILAVLAGAWIRKIVSEKTIKWIGALIFILFGIITLGKLFI